MKPHNLDISKLPIHFKVIGSLRPYVFFLLWLLFLCLTFSSKVSLEMNLIVAIGSALILSIAAIGFYPYVEYIIDTDMVTKKTYSFPFLAPAVFTEPLSAYNGIGIELIEMELNEKEKSEKMVVAADVVLFHYRGIPDECVHLRRFSVDKDMSECFEFQNLACRTFNLPPGRILDKSRIVFTHDESHPAYSFLSREKATASTCLPSENPYPPPNDSLVASTTGCRSDFDHVGEQAIEGLFPPDERKEVLSSHTKLFRQEGVQILGAVIGAILILTGLRIFPYWFAHDSGKIARFIETSRHSYIPTAVLDSGQRIWVPRSLTSCDEYRNKHELISGDHIAKVRFSFKYMVNGVKHDSASTFAFIWAIVAPLSLKAYFMYRRKKLEEIARGD